MGEIIWVANPAVPRRRFAPRVDRTIWAPPAGELIAGVWRDASPVRSRDPREHVADRRVPKPNHAGLHAPGKHQGAHLSVHVRQKSAAGHQLSSCVSGLGGVQP